MLAPGLEPAAAAEPEPVLVLLVVGEVLAVGDDVAPAVVELPSGGVGATLDPALGPHGRGVADAVEFVPLVAGGPPFAVSLAGTLPGVEPWSPAMLSVPVVGQLG